MKGTCSARGLFSGKLPAWKSGDRPEKKGGEKKG
jgi:hypothetical protein